MRSLLRAAGLAACCFAATAVLAWSAAGPVARVQARGPAAVDDLLALSAAGVCALLLGWLSVAALLCLLCVAADSTTSWLGRITAQLTPAVLRRAVGLTVGVALATAPVAPATAATRAWVRSAHGTAPTATATAAPRAGLPDSWDADRPAPTDCAGRPDEAVVVRPGDTLWGLAARQLSRARRPAPAAAVAAEWPRWHHANRSVIGPDPDRLVPGQRLRVPSGEAGSCEVSR